MPNNTHSNSTTNQAENKIKGVFSIQTLMKIGAGTTQRKKVQKSYWFANEIENGMVEIQPLNLNYVPSGPKKLVPKDEFLDKFSPEPEFYTYTVYPKIRELNKTIARADRHRKRGETYSAEYEYNNALKIDEENIRANFGLGLTYLERGDKEKAKDIFDRLVKLDAAFEAEHKHLFNEFGINLRKQEMYEEAVDYYGRALELSPDDENLHCNIARAYYGLQKYDKVVAHLKKALELNPNFEEAKKFVQYLKKNKLVPAETLDTITTKIDDSTK
ncbi:tetratricopeptide repeat protein [Desulfovulcanus sp.]